MAHNIFCFLCLLIASFTSLFGKPSVLVSIAPYRTFVEQIAGDSVDITLVVPTGASSHTFEPTAKQMIQMSQADLWFRLGESFEKRLMEVLVNYNPKIEIVDLREHVKMICSNHVHDHAGHRCSEDMRDIHIWLSPREVKKQARDIANALIKKYPENRELYQKNVTIFTNRLDSIDKEISEKLIKNKNASFLVSHPAYAYFARDYNLNQLSVEFEGRDPTPQQLTDLIKTAKKLNICTVFIQPQHNNKGAKLIASHLGAKVISLDPYSEDYFNNLLTLAELLGCGQSNGKEES